MSDEEKARQEIDKKWNERQSEDHNPGAQVSDDVQFAGYGQNHVIAPNAWARLGPQAESSPGPQNDITDGQETFP